MSLLMTLSLIPCGPRRPVACSDRAARVRLVCSRHLCVSVRTAGRTGSTQRTHPSQAYNTSKSKKTQPGFGLRSSRASAQLVGGPLIQAVALEKRRLGLGLSVLNLDILELGTPSDLQKEFRDTIGDEDRF